MQFLLLEAPKLVIARNSHQRNACIVHLCPIASDSKCYAEKKVAVALRSDLVFSLHD